jgi:hypothetical protein
MNTQVLRDSSQRIVGYIETKPDGLHIGRDALHQIKGYYDASQNTTRDSSGRLLGYGDELASLILNS